MIELGYAEYRQYLAAGEVAGTGKASQRDNASCSEGQERHFKNFSGGG